MVDFKKLRARKAGSAVIDPVEIFRRLPKPPGINDLYTSQAQVLSDWFARRDENDLVVKLHTGGGKTLVGLLVGQSTLNEKNEPVIYLSPTNQLVAQTVAKAQEYGIRAVPYESNADFPDEFLSGRSILICSYHALFNGLSRFGTRDGTREIVHAAAMILDDAHASFSIVREQFTLSVRKDKDNEGYAFLTNTFRNDFKEIDRLGTFDDVVTGGDWSVLEVPYWAWTQRLLQVQEYLKGAQTQYKFPWMFLRDALGYCQCLISRQAFVITPVFPLVDAIPTFAECPRRIYMSATIGDDSTLVRTFDARPDSIAKPIYSTSLAGVSERMILAPELMTLEADVDDTVRRLATWVVEKKKKGAVVLVPSQHAAEAWKAIATFPNKTEQVSEAVEKLQSGESLGPFVFANRYDGIDLPGDACRLLIMSGLPRGASEYDLYRANVFLGGTSLNSELAQRIEQGIGRGARGSNDYCIVAMTGKDLIAWISRSSNLKLLTNSTRAQLEMGAEISRSVVSRKDLAETMQRCLDRDREWTQFHAETLADTVAGPTTDDDTLRQAALERRAFNLLRDGYFEKAIEKLKSYCDERPALDRKTKGWLLQMAASAAHHWGQSDLALKLQQSAFAANRGLPRPKVVAPYEPLTLPGRQSEAIVQRICEFANRRGVLAEFDEITSHLVAEASANQFEQALADVAGFLGFIGERPEQTDPKGPDVLWLLNDAYGLVIEAKSRKKADNALTREEHGQLLHAAEWFRSTYPKLKCVRVSVHPNATVTRSTVASDTKALTFDNLKRLVADTRALLEELCRSQLEATQLVVRCEKQLAKTRLIPSSLADEYLVPFNPT